ncbi:hypothetical protein Rhopal_006928-T1 [Rhodotorula paludigena]|uniref:Capsular associated protein n=1 Tax=Rhodotorula paludigena TaxID=86838 RepID=A0AAV5GVA1_9BASI|nr:hypothetical protein Rhopal_006928-T1 [Rhodotorula paludigena]
MLVHRVPSPVTSLVPTFSKALPALPALRTSSAPSPASCRPCDIDPTNPLCEYGDSAIRVSRAYEGSGVRVRKVLAKALRGEKVKIGVLGASVTAGHGLDHGGKVVGPAWPYRWLEDFQKTFPQTELYNGAAPAMDSAFYSFCYRTMVPETDIDMWLVELDVNNDFAQTTLEADDVLFRTLLNLPNEPAVIRLSVFALSFDDMARGAASNLLLSQFFDIPVITIKNFFLPYLLERPDVAPEYFTKFWDGAPDYRHVNVHGHNALADMLSLYMAEQLCITRQELARGRLLAKADTPWPTEDTWGKVPRLHVDVPRRQFTATGRVDQSAPVCNFAASKSHPLLPMHSSRAAVIGGSPTIHDEHMSAGWQRVEWNDKAAWSSSEPGSVIRFPAEGSTVGVAVWTWSGPKKGLTAELPGQVACWIDDAEGDAVTIDAYQADGPAHSKWTEVQNHLPTEKHVVSCRILGSSSSGGHEVRIMGLVSH